jgi:predicted metal-dependent hydrolase
MDGENYEPVIVGFVADIFFAVKIEETAKALGYRVEWIERVDQVAPPEPDLPGRQLGEHLVGPGAVLIDLITRWGPVLLIFDLNNNEIPWQEWITMLSSVPATRRIPILAFGSHVDVGATQKAKSAGAKEVVARSRFVSALPQLIEKHALRIDFRALQAACRQPISKRALQGIEEFNRGDYFEAHETLEEAWMEEKAPIRDLYRAVLQVAVAYLQIERANYNGAAKMFLRVRQWIDPLPDVCCGIDIVQLREDARRAHAALLNLGPEGIHQFDPSLLRPVRYSPPPQASTPPPGDPPSSNGKHSEG